MVNEVIPKVPTENAWEVHLAAMLAQIGFLTKAATGDGRLDAASSRRNPLFGLKFPSLKPK
jgi:hypothetical protein